MKCMRKTAGCPSTVYKPNPKISKQLNTTPVLARIQKYRRNWLQHKNITTLNRLPRIIKKMQTKKQKELGEITEGNSACETGTDQQVAQVDNYDDDDDGDDEYQGQSVRV